MKKVFIGCGVVVLIVLVLLGYVLWSVWPNMMTMKREWTAAIEQLEALDKQYPFDPKAQSQLDPARFKAALEVHALLTDDFVALEGRIEQAQGKEGGPGVIDSIRQMFDQLAPVITGVAGRLKDAGMGPEEFGYDTRVMWAVLYRVDHGLAPKELDVLKGQYTSFDTHYAAMQKDQKALAELKTLLGEVPLEALTTAEQVMVGNIDLVQRALARTDIEYLYMQPHYMENAESLEGQAFKPVPAAPVNPAAPAHPASPTTPPSDAPAAPAAPPPAEPAPR